MGSVESDLLNLFDEERKATRSTRAIRTLVTRRVARRRATRLAGATVAALAVVGLAATAAVSLGRDVPPAVPPETVLGTVTIPFDSPFGASGIPTPLGVACGDPAPTPVTRADGIEWDVAAPPGALYPGAGITTTLRSTGGDTAPASVSPLGFIVVRDGVVAGWTYNSEYADQAEFHYLDAYSFDHVRGTIDGADYVCPGQGSQYFLAPGDTEWYPIVHVTASPEIAARQYLALQGFSVPGDSPEELAAYSPGSWDCEQLLAPPALGEPAGPPNMPGPTALCAPSTLEGVTLDRDAKTITVPYTARLYTRTLDVTLVGDPLTFTQPPRAGDPPAGSTGFDMAPPVPVSDTSVLTCGAHVDAGANYGTGRKSGAVQQGVFQPAAGTTFGTAATVDLSLLPPELTPFATVAYPERLRVWFLADAPIPANGLPKLRGPGFTVIGTALASVNGGAPVSLDRVQGPTATTVTFTEARWCQEPGADPTTVVAFEGLERAGNDASAESSVFDFWFAYDRFDPWGAK
jgi:hypothetical protein